MHMHEFMLPKTLGSIKIAIYYAFQFIKRLDLLLPLSLLIAIIKVLYSMNYNREIVALRASGLAVKSFTKPLVWLSFICVVLNYLNYEFFLPSARTYIDHFEQQFIQRAVKKQLKSMIYSAMTLDGKRLIYQKDQNGNLFDAYIIQSISDIWHMKYLTINERSALAKYVDHFQRNEEGYMQKIASYEEKTFAPFRLMSTKDSLPVIAPENQSISDLFIDIIKNHPSSYNKKAQIETYLYYKLIMPWISLLIMVTIVPFCIKFSRESKAFLLYTLGLLGYIAFYTIMNACLIMGTNRLLPPVVAMLFIPLLGFCLAGLNFKRVDTCLGT